MALATVVGLLLLIISVNIANLTLAHTASMQRETAVRMAIGAGRTRILRQTAIESLLLAIVGAAVGFGLSVAASRGVAAFWDSGPGRVALDLRVDAGLFAFVASAALLSAMVAGLAPTLRATSIAPNSAIHTGGDRLPAGRSCLGAVLLAAQIAFSLCSLRGAFLLSGTLSTLRNAPRDFTLDGVVTFSLAPVADSYEGRDLTGYYQQLLAEVRAIPGIRAAALADNTPMEVWPSPFDVEAASPNAVEGVTATSGCVSPELFPALKTPLLVGRLFNSGDRAGTEKVAIVNQSLAKDLFGNISPIGEQLGFGSEASVRNRRVIGIVQDRGYRGSKQPDAPAVYVPCTQRGRVWAEGYLTLVVRADGPSSDIAGPVSERIEALAVEFPVRAATLRMRAEQALVSERVLTALSGAIALIALVLAGIGVFSLASYKVRVEQRAIGVRMAIGADQRRVVSWMLSRMI